MRLQIPTSKQELFDSSFWKSFGDPGSNRISKDWEIARNQNPANNPGAEKGNVFKRHERAPYARSHQVASF